MTVSRPGDRGVVYALRKVGAPQGRMLASGQSGRPAGKCHREQTADGPAPWDRAQVRVKRCGKSAPAAGVTRPARQTPSGARPNRERVVRPPTLPGWPHRWMVTHPDPVRDRRTEPRLQVGSPSPTPSGARVVLFFPPPGQLAGVRRTVADTGRATSKRILGPAGNGPKLQFHLGEIDLDR